MSLLINGAGPAIFDASGNLGVGTTSPSQKLDVQATSGANAFWLTSTTGTNPVYSRYANSGGYVYMGRDGSAGSDFGNGAYTSAIWCTGTYDFIIGVNSTMQARVKNGGDFQCNSGYGSVATAYGCRAWVNFNGTTASPSTMRGNGNVSSVTKNSTGNYTVNFTTAMPDANYAVNMVCGGYTTETVGYFGTVAYNTTSVQVVTKSNVSTTPYDHAAVSVTIFR